ncbi:MAG: hypothetical protein WAT71_08600 [Ignavibacteria bacterium]
MKISKNNIFYITSFIFAIWFALTGFAWVYYVNIIFSLPFGIMSLVLWYFGKRSDPNKNRYKYIIYILSIGVIISLLILILLLLRN